MATVCPVCGQRLRRSARLCDVCGEPFDAVDSAASSAGVLAPTAGLAQQTRSADHPGGVAVRVLGRADGPTLPRRARLLLLVGLSVAAIALSATCAALLSPQMSSSDGAAYGRARLSPDPQLRWQRELTQVAPDLRCPTSPAQDRPDADACSITASSTVQDVVVVAVQRAQQAELVALTRADGAVSWRRRAPAGSTYDCMVTGTRLWCLTVPLVYQVVPLDTVNGSRDGGFKEYPTRGAGYRGATLTRLAPSTGRILRSTPVPGSDAGVAFAGIGMIGFYVLGQGSQNVGTVARFSAQGALQWSHEVTLVEGGPRSTLRPTVAGPRVHELGGRALVSLTEVDGVQAVFTITGGGLVRSGAGHVVTVIAGAVVTQVGTATLRIDGRTIPENAVAALAADDRSSGEPVLVTRASAPLYDTTAEGAQATFISRAPADPLGVTHRLKEGEEPVAYCAGVIITLAAGAVAGYDAVSGARRWVAGDLDGPNLTVRCTGSRVVFANGYQATAFSVQNGAQAWSLTYPLGSIVTSGGYGDPSGGLVVGPSNDAGLPTGPTSMSYLR